MNSEPLWVMAFDHRDSFRSTFLGLRGPPTPADQTLIRRLKSVIFDGLVEAVDAGIRTGVAGALVDEEYGADIIGAAHRRGIPTAVPVEASGHRQLRFEHGDDGFGEVLARVNPTYAKVLVRYHPLDEASSKSAQRDRLLRLQDHVAATGRQWMLELLAPPPPGAQPEPDDRRADHTVAVVTELVECGLAPHLWKLEGMPTSDAYGAISAVACRGGTARCLVLGRGADEGAVDRWLTLAAPVPGFAGFAVGRTLWWKPLHAHLHGLLSAADAARTIAANYRRLIDVYVSATKTPTG